MSLLSSLAYIRARNAFRIQFASMSLNKQKTAIMNKLEVG